MEAAKWSPTLIYLHTFHMLVCLPKSRRSKGREEKVSSLLGESLTVLPLLLLLGRVRSPITIIVDQDIIICLTGVFAVTLEPRLSLPGDGDGVIHRGKAMPHQLPAYCLATPTAELSSSTHIP